ncbi:Ras guanine nucleotide exchange factor [Pelomyxa schiedti]|nr:Ras guanine nucleotide exchange factor [Pelomyxa schiedti]
MSQQDEWGFTEAQLTTDDGYGSTTSVAAGGADYSIMGAYSAATTSEYPVAVPGLVGTDDYASSPSSSSSSASSSLSSSADDYVAFMPPPPPLAAPASSADLLLGSPSVVAVKPSVSPPPPPPPSPPHPSADAVTTSNAEDEYGGVTLVLRKLSSPKPSPALPALLLPRKASGPVGYTPTALCGNGNGNGNNGSSSCSFASSSPNIAYAPQVSQQQQSQQGNVNPPISPPFFASIPPPIVQEGIIPPPPPFDVAPPPMIDVPPPPPLQMETSADAIPPPPPPSNNVDDCMAIPPPQPSPSPTIVSQAVPMSPPPSPVFLLPKPPHRAPHPPPGEIAAFSPPPFVEYLPPSNDLPPPLPANDVPPPVTDNLPPPMSDGLPPVNAITPPPTCDMDILPPPDIPPPTDFIPPPSSSTGTTPTREFRQSMPLRRGSIEDVDEPAPISSSSASWQRSFIARRGPAPAPSAAAIQENIRLRGELKMLREQVELTKKNLAGNVGLDPLLHFNDLKISTESFDTLAENCILRMERNHIQYQMLAIKTFFSLSEEVAKLKTGKEVLQKMCKTLQGQLEAALNTTSDYSEEGIIFTIDKKNPNNTEKEIKGGTIEKLVARLFAKNVESQYLDIFLLTYRSYTDANTVLGMVIKAFDDNTSTAEEANDPSVSAQQRTVKKKTTRLRICNVLRRWTDNYWHDFWDDPALLETYKRFVEANKEVQGLLKPGLDKRLALGSAILQRTWVFSTDPPPPIVPTRATFEEIDPIEIARQMSLQEFELYVNIQAKELLSLSWSKKDKEKRSPNLLAMIHRFNTVSNWTTATIVKEPDLRKRANIVRKFVRILEELLKLNNFNAVFEISAGLNSSAITRLKLTWAEVKDTSKIMDKMGSITAPTSSFASLRQFLHSANPPCIPYLGVYLTDLTFIEEGNTDTIENTYVHFAKFRMVAGVIQEMQQYQQKPYNFSRVDSIQTFLNNLDSLSEKEAFDLSLAIERRQPAAGS